MPYYLLGVLLVYLLAFKLPIFPISGGAPSGVLPSLTLGYMVTVIYHSMLPALSIVLAAARLLGARDARHDGHDAGRRFHDDGRGRRASEGGASF